MYLLLRALVGIKAVIFIVLAVAHFGFPMPGLAEARLLPAALLDGLCALCLLYASLHGGARTAFAAEAAAFAGALLALALMALEPLPRMTGVELIYLLLLALAGPGVLIADRLSRGR